MPGIRTAAVLLVSVGGGPVFPTAALISSGPSAPVRIGAAVSFGCTGSVSPFGDAAVAGSCARAAAGLSAGVPDHQGTTV